MPVLYLDFDGVLHPSEVYLKNGQPTLICDDPYVTLFCWAPILESILADFPDIKVRLSTSWVRVKSFDYAKDWLPKSIQDRITGGTFHRHMNKHEFELMTRYQQIRADANRNGIIKWVAIDDDGHGWPEAEKDYLVRTDGDHGLLQAKVQRELREKLEWLTQK